MDISKSDLLELNNLLNNLHPDIKFTMEYSNVQQPFLDVLVKREILKAFIHVIHTGYYMAEMCL